MDFERKATIYPSKRATSKKMIMIMNEKEEPKGNGYIVSPYLRQMAENL